MDETYVGNNIVDNPSYSSYWVVVTVGRSSSEIILKITYAI